MLTKSGLITVSLPITPLTLCVKLLFPVWLNNSHKLWTPENGNKAPGQERSAAKQNLEVMGHLDQIHKQVFWRVFSLADHTSVLQSLHLPVINSHTLWSWDSKQWHSYCVWSQGCLLPVPDVSALWLLWEAFIMFTFLSSLGTCFHHSPKQTRASPLTPCGVRVQRPQYCKGGIQHKQMPQSLTQNRGTQA